MRLPLDEDKCACGCGGEAHLDKPSHPLPSFTVTRAQLKRLRLWDLFVLYKRCISDEMSPIMFRGYGKAAAINMIMHGHEHDSVTLQPFI